MQRTLEGRQVLQGTVLYVARSLEHTPRKILTQIDKVLAVHRFCPHLSRRYFVEDDRPGRPYTGHKLGDGWTQLSVELAAKLSSAFAKGNNEHIQQFFRHALKPAVVQSRYMDIANSTYNVIGMSSGSSHNVDKTRSYIWTHLAP